MIDMWDQQDESALTEILKNRFSHMFTRCKTVTKVEMNILPKAIAKKLL